MDLELEMERTHPPPTHHENVHFAWCGTADDNNDNQRKIRALVSGVIKKEKHFLTEKILLVYIKCFYYYPFKMYVEYIFSPGCLSMMSSSILRL